MRKGKVHVVIWNVDGDIKVSVFKTERAALADTAMHIKDEFASDLDPHAEADVRAGVDNADVVHRYQEAMEELGSELRHPAYVKIIPTQLE